jgi:hypothetical protein
MPTRNTAANMQATMCCAVKLHNNTFRGIRHILVLSSRIRQMTLRIAGWIKGYATPVHIDFLV